MSDSPATLAGMSDVGTNDRITDEDWYAQDLSGREWRDTTFVDVDLTEASGVGASFEECTFRGVKFNAASFTECAFTACVFDRCNFFDVTFERCKLVGSVFSNSKLDLVKAERGNWSFVDMTRADVGSAQFNGVRFREANLRELRGGGAVLTGCDLSGADLELANLSGATLLGSDLSAVDPRTATLDGAVITPDQATVLVEALGLVVRPE